MQHFLKNNVTFPNFFLIFAFDTVLFGCLVVWLFSCLVGCDADKNEKNNKNENNNNNINNNKNENNNKNNNNNKNENKNNNKNKKQRQNNITTMKTFFNAKDLGDITMALDEAKQIKANRYAYDRLGKNKTLLMVFFNNSLRTRLSTQKAAMNLGMNVIVLDVNAGAWKLETERGVIMDGDKSEHLLEAIPVMGSFCDIIGIRSFAGLTDRDYDYAETIVNQFVKYSGKPVFAMETATVHPLQAFADLITIEEHKTKKRVKAVLTWAPHCRCLPQAVPNSFAEWMIAAPDVDLVITHPEGYELDPAFTQGAEIEYNQKKAFEGADFIYAKNWSCPGVTRPQDYGKILTDYKQMAHWTVDAEHMSWTDNGKFLHCLPVRRGLIVTDDVIESANSLVIPEAANREISCQVVLKRMLEAL